MSLQIIIYTMARYLHAITAKSNISIILFIIYDAFSVCFKRSELILSFGFFSFQWHVVRFQRTEHPMRIIFPIVLRLIVYNYKIYRYAFILYYSQNRRSNRY